MVVCMKKKDEQELSRATRRHLLSCRIEDIPRSEDQSLLEGLELAVERLHDARIVSDVLVLFPFCESPYCSRTRRW